MKKKNKQSLSFDFGAALAMKWLNYHVVIDERRGCGQEKKKQTKKQPEKATSSVFVGSFCTFGFTCAVTLPHLGKDTLKKEPGIYLFFLWKTFWDNTKKKLIQVHNEIFYMIPDSSSMFFCPRGEHPHVRQFFGRWVICLKVLPFAFRTNRRLLLPALLLHRMRRRLEIIGLKSKLIDHWWMMDDLARIKGLDILSKVAWNSLWIFG